MDDALRAAGNEVVTDGLEMRQRAAEEDDVGG